LLIVDVLKLLKDAILHQFELGLICLSWSLLFGNLLLQLFSALKTGALEIESLTK
jgi:hypothetical protein